MSEWCTRHTGGGVTPSCVTNLINVCKLHTHSDRVQSLYTFQSHLYHHYPSSSSGVSLTHWAPIASVFVCVCVCVCVWQTASIPACRNVLQAESWIRLSEALRFGASPRFKLHIRFPSLLTQSVPHVTGECVSSACYTTHNPVCPLSPCAVPMSGRGHAAPEMTHSY